MLVKQFFYCDGAEIQVDDRVYMDDIEQSGVVSEIIQPNTDQARIQKALATGGVMFCLDSGEYYFWSEIDEHLFRQS